MWPVFADECIDAVVVPRDGNTALRNLRHRDIRGHALLHAQVVEVTVHAAAVAAAQAEGHIAVLRIVARDGQRVVLPSLVHKVCRIVRHKGRRVVHVGHRAHLEEGRATAEVEPEVGIHLVNDCTHLTDVDARQGKEGAAAGVGIERQIVRGTVVVAARGAVTVGIARLCQVHPVVGHLTVNIFKALAVGQVHPRVEGLHRHCLVVASVVHRVASRIDMERVVGGLLQSRKGMRTFGHKLGHTGAGHKVARQLPRRLVFHIDAAGTSRSGPEERQAVLSGCLQGGVGDGAGAQRQIVHIDVVQVAVARGGAEGEVEARAVVGAQVYLEMHPGCGYQNVVVHDLGKGGGIHWVVHHAHCEPRVVVVGSDKKVGIHIAQAAAAIGRHGGQRHAGRRAGTYRQAQRMHAAVRSEDSVLHVEVLHRVGQRPAGRCRARGVALKVLTVGQHHRRVEGGQLHRRSLAQLRAVLALGPQVEAVALARQQGVDGQLRARHGHRVARAAAAHGVHSHPGGAVVAHRVPVQRHAVVGYGSGVEAADGGAAEPQVVNIGVTIIVVKIAERDVAPCATVDAEVHRHGAVVPRGVHRIDGHKAGGVVGQRHHAHHQRGPLGIDGLGAAHLKAHHQSRHLLLGSRHHNEVAPHRLTAHLEGCRRRSVVLALTVVPHVRMGVVPLQHRPAFRTPIVIVALKVLAVARLDGGAQRRGTVLGLGADAAATRAVGPHVEVVGRPQTEPCQRQRRHSIAHNGAAARGKAAGAPLQLDTVGGALLAPGDNEATGGGAVAHHFFHPAAAQREVVEIDPARPTGRRRLLPKGQVAPRTAVAAEVHRILLPVATVGEVERGDGVEGGGVRRMGHHADMQPRLVVVATALCPEAKGQAAQRVLEIG